MPVVQEHTITIKQDRRLVKIVLQERTKTNTTIEKHRAKCAVPENGRMKSEEKTSVLRALPASTSTTPRLQPAMTKKPIVKFAAPVKFQSPTVRLIVSGALPALTTMTTRRRKANTITQPIVLYAVPVHIRQKPVEQLIATKVVVPAPTSMIPTMRPNTTKLPIALHAVPVHIPQL